MEFSYFVSSSSGSGSENEQPKQKRQRITRVWLKRDTYASAKEAEEVIRTRKIWAVCASTDTPSGHRVEYRCTAGKYRVAECPAGLYLLYHNTSQRVTLYETSNEHDNHITDPSRGLSVETKTFIKNKYAEGITKPNALLELFRQKGMVEPEKSKLDTFLRTLRIEKLGNPSVSANDLRIWCEQHSKYLRTKMSRLCSIFTFMPSRIMLTNKI